LVLQQALAVSQAKALRNAHFSAVAVAKLKFCNSLCCYGFYDNIPGKIIV
jgi:hypothetical protein